MTELSSVRAGEISEDPSAVLRSRLKWLIALASAVFILIVQPTYALPLERQLPIYFAAIGAWAFVAYPILRGRLGWVGFGLDLLLAALIAASGIYLLATLETLLYRAGSYSTADVVMGSIALVTTLEATRRAIGWPLVVIAIVFVAYAVTGPSHLPLMIAHPPHDLEDLTGQTYLGFTGIFGLPLKVMVRYIVLFIIFGCILEVSGGASFLIDFARAISGRYVGGVGKVAVVASGSLGSIYGSAVANVATTGCITIPAMRRAGYAPHIAAGIEAVASTGGMITPPVMGAVGFLMAEFVGIPYSAVVLAAVVPACLYYLCAGSAVHFYAARNGLKGYPGDDLPRLGEVLKKGWIQLIPLVLLITLLLRGFSPTYSAIWAIGAAVAVALVNRTRPRDLIDAVANAGNSAAQLSIASAAIGIVMGVIQLTGIGAQLSSIMIHIAAGNLPILLLLTMGASIIMGMGITSAVVYILQATLIAPAMIELGVQELSAHFFLMYFGAMAMITPPVALASYAAAALADAKPDVVGWTGLRIALPIFLLPWMIVYNPGLLLGEAPIIDTVLPFLTAATGIIAFSACSMGYWRGVLAWPLRIVGIVGAFAMIVPGLWTDLAGLALLAIVALWQERRRPVG